MRSKLSPVALVTLNVNVSVPLPVFEIVCGKNTWPPAADCLVWASVVSAKLETCCTIVSATFEVAVRGVLLESV